MTKNAIHLLLALPLVSCGSGDAPTVPSNRPPELTRTPPPTTFHNPEWRYTPVWSDPEGDATTLEVVHLPDWVTFSTTGVEFHGVPGWENIGPHAIRFRLDDGTNNVLKAFSIEVEKGEIDCDAGWPASPAESEYVLPYRAGLAFNISQSYCNPTNSHNLLHAYDIDLNTGDTLIASRAGTVRTVRDHFPDDNGTAGQENWVWIEHDDGSIMNYVHIAMGGALVEQGERVSQGQPIAISGNTGLTHRPHVHTALYREADFSRQASIPIAYRNAQGALDANGGLRVNHSYTAGQDNP